MSFEYPQDLKYLDSHEYVRIDGDVATVGISAYAQDSLGEIVFVELPEIGQELCKGDEFGNIESVKAVSDVYAPLSGEIIECNTTLEDVPETLNEDPYKNGWLVKIKITDPSELDSLLTADAYRTLVEAA